MAVLTDLQEEKATITAPYDVFLSFRGQDTRLTFIDHLYQALLNENIGTYLDEDEIETGEDLKPELSRAIRNSRASIIVLSENYASSTWCLDELVMILEQQRTSKHIVLPIFYHVEPTNIRKQQSSFGDALVKHQRRIEAEKDLHKKSQGARKLELWTKALRQVVDLKGKDAHGRRETVFIEEIVTEISSRLDLHLRWNIPQLMGRDFSIDSISSWLKEGSRKTVAILTIWGMAGIGKTSLAKYIYQLHYQEFERSSFVEDIERRCAQKSSALLDLQKQLLGDLLKKSMIEVHDVNVYTAKIEKALLNKQTLVVLDGIDNFEQLDVLVGTKHFHPGSKIIVTTKDRSLTEKCELFRTTSPPKHTKHKLDCLSDTESLRLLCWHAVGGHGPKEGYEEETKKFAKYCGGHPLALKVLGRSLLNEDVATWSETFEMLEKEEMCTDIEKVLRISFDSLPSENCKELFKHIACFFVGKDWGSTETILKECGIRTSAGIMKLVDRGLLMVGPQNRLMMHQLLQEIGRDLVRQESPKKPWKRSRLWNHEESLSVLKEEKGTKKIQGLVLDMRMLEKRRSHGTSSLIEKKFHDDSDKYFRAIPLIHRAYDILSRIWRFFSWLFLLFSSSPGQEMGLRTKAFCKMDKLHLLQLDYVKLNGSYKNFPKGLRSLSMRGFPSKYIPSDLPMENLVALDMSRSNLKRAWKNFKMYYEFGIFSTCFPGKEVPNWLAHTSMGSSISFTIPSSPKNQSIQGLDVCFVHAFSGIGKVGSSRTKIRNITKNQTWIHYAYIFAVKEGNEEGIVWLSHWMFGNNEFEDGDEVSVTIVEEEEDCGVVVRECGAGPVYFGDKEEDPLDYYKSWKHIIGGDLSAFQLTSGDYFLTHDRFIHDPDEFKELFQHRTTQNLLGYTPRYKQDEATQATGILPIDMLFFSAE